MTFYNDDRVPHYVLDITLTNEDKGYQFSQWDERIDDYDLVDGKPDMGAIYRYMRREYGRCQSSVYVDTATGVKRVGWFFVSRQRYDDTGERYLRGAWVTVAHVKPATYESVSLDA